VRVCPTRCLAITGLLLVLGGCGSDDTVISTPPAPMVHIGGEWETTYTELSDTCGINLPAFYESSTRFHDPPGLEYFYSRIPWGSCDAYSTANTTRTGNKLTSSTSTFESVSSTCSVKHDATVEYNFTENAYTGTERHTFSYNTGDCGSFTNCQWVARIDATRCAECERGCTCCGPDLEWPVLH